MASAKFKLDKEDVFSAVRHTVVPFVALVAQEIYATGGEVPNVTKEGAASLVAGIVRLAWRLFRNYKQK